MGGVGAGLRCGGQTAVCHCLIQLSLSMFLSDVLMLWTADAPILTAFTNALILIRLQSNAQLISQD